MQEKKPIVISNKSSFAIIIHQDKDGWWYCDLPSTEDGSPVPVVVTRDFFNWFPQTKGIVWGDDEFHLAKDDGGDAMPIFLYKGNGV